MNYPDVATFVEVESNGYSRGFSVVERDDVSGIFIQDLATNRFLSATNINADAIFYPDPSSDFITNNYHRLEGMYLFVSPFGQNTWYRITRCTVNRDHLLTYRVDNIELYLEKSAPIPNVS